MSRTLPLPAILIATLLSLPNLSHAVGIAANENFIVVAAEQVQAEQILDRAESHRQRIAERWLGKRLAAGKGKTIVHVEAAHPTSSGQGEEPPDDGTFWAIDHPLRTHHRLWLSSSDEESLDHLLAHEITHLVLAIEYGDRIPPWAGEGLASREDDLRRKDVRQEKLRQLTASGRPTDIQQLLHSNRLSCHDQTGYALACALVEELLSRGDSQRLLAFAAAGTRIGWDAATRSHYGISLEELESAWLQSTRDAAERNLASRSAGPPASPQVRR